jgi:hypothetical protein
MRTAYLLAIAIMLLLLSCETKPQGKTWQEYAIMTGDPSKCDSASHPDVCRAGFTQATGDGSACDRISDSTWKKTCEAYDRGMTAQAQGQEQDESDEEKDCQYDSECSSICEGNTAWKQGCDPRKGRCIKTFDTDCTQDIETFGSNSFPKVCSAGTCVRDRSAIDKKKQELEAEKERLKTAMRESSARRASLIAAKDEANKNCLGGLSDATVILMNEFATKTAGIIAGGVGVVKDATSHVVSWTTPVPDYINKGLDDMSKAGTDEQKLTLDEYVVLNCKLNEYFGKLLDESDDYVDSLTEEARQVDADYDALP